MKTNQLLTSAAATIQFSTGRIKFEVFEDWFVSFDIKTIIFSHHQDVKYDVSMEDDRCNRFKLIADSIATCQKLKLVAGINIHFLCVDTLDGTVFD